MKKIPFSEPPSDLTLARRATSYAALPENERRERAHMAAWHCVCMAQARRFVREVATDASTTSPAPHGYGQMYGEKLSKHPAGDDMKGIDY